MTQAYRILTEDDFMSDSLEALMNNDMSNRTNFSGDEFPTDIVQGQFYYQPEINDEGKVVGKGKLYLCFDPDVQEATDGFVLLSDLNKVNVDTTQFNAHLNNVSNPHKVTASQVGTYDKTGIDNIVATLAKKDMSNVNTSSYATFKGATEQNNGTTGVLPAPGINNRNNFLRGDGVWIPIKQGFEGFPIGFRMDWDGDIIPSGWVEEVGQVLKRSDYPEAWNFATSYGMVVTDVSWINDHLHGKFSSGDGTTTFRMPDRRNCFNKYGNTSVGKMNPASPNYLAETDATSGGGNWTTQIPADGSWSGWQVVGSNGGLWGELLRFRNSGGDGSPQHIITRSIRKMK